MATELGKAYVQIVPSAQGISGSVAGVLRGESKSAGEESGRTVGKSFAGKLTGVLKAAGIGYAIKKTFDGVSSQVKSVAEFGDTIDKMSQKLGMSSTSYQEWDFVMQHCGTSMDAMQTSMKTLANAAENNSKAFEELGISQQQIASMSQEELFGATIKALQGVSDTTKRTYLSGKLLGRGATELGALLNTSADEVESMKKQVHKLGGVMSKDAVKASAAFQDAMQNLQTSLKGVSRGLMTNVLAPAASVMEGLAKVFSGDNSGMAAIQNGIQTLMQHLANMVANLGPTITMMITTIMNIVITSLPQFIDAGMQLIASLASGIGQSLPTLIPQAVEAIMLIVETMLTNIPAIVTGAMELIVGFAEGLINAIPVVIDKLGDIIDAILKAIMDSIPQIINAGVRLLIALIDNLPLIITTIVNALPRIIDGIVNGLLNNIDKLIMAGIDLFVAIVTNLPAIIAGIIKAVPKIIQGIIDAFVNLAHRMWEAGKALVTGLWEGIKGAAKWLWDKITGWISGIWKGIKSFFGIGSPSKQMAWVGEMIDRGLAGGILDNVKPVSKAMDELGDVATRSFESDVAFNAVAASKQLSALAAQGGMSAISSEQKQPAILTFVLGGLEFQTFVDNITALQDKKVQLQLSY